MRSKLRISAVLAFLFVAATAFAAHAEEIKVVLVGQTHAMLYPCHCPVEADGGIARRATLLKELARKNKNLFVIDSGSFFAGGPLDQNAKGEELDRARTALHIKAMQAMGYDAAALGEDEFNFGTQFLKESFAGSKVALLSANIESDFTVPCVVKKFGNTVVGVVAVTSPAAEPKAGGLKFIEPRGAVRSAVEGAKKQGAGIIVLVSGLDEISNQELISHVPDITILIEGATYAKEQVSRNVGTVLVMTPRWEGRRVVAANLTVQANRLINAKTEDLRVWDKLKDDKDMLAMLPKCFSDGECRKEGMIGSCQNPGRQNAQCQFAAAPKVPLTVITSTGCRTCKTDDLVNLMKRQFTGLAVTTVNYPSSKADALIKELGLTGLPAYLFGKEIEKEKGFESLKQNMETAAGYYMLKPQVAGMGFFLNRKKLANRFDVFLSLANQDTAQLLEVIREFEPKIHFLIMDDGQTFQAAGGEAEIEESLRAVCVQKYYPQSFYSYIACRAKNPGSAWWDDCIQDVDNALIKQCARGPEGAGLLRDNISLNRELSIANGPTYLLDNQEVFGSSKVPDKEELRTIIMR